MYSCNVFCILNVRKSIVVRLAISKLSNQSYKGCSDFSKHEYNCYVFEINCVMLFIFFLMFMKTLLGLSQFSQMFPSMPKGKIIGNMVNQMIDEVFIYRNI